MFFTIKKLISIFLMPLSIALILASIALIYLFLKKYGKAKIYLLLSIFWTFAISYAPISNALIKPLEQNYASLIHSDFKNISHVLVLGSGHSTNEDLSIVSQVSATALVRLNEGIRIYRTLKNAKLVVSGYSGKHDSTPHALMQKKLALALGIPSSDIITMVEPKDTYDEAVEFKKIIGNKSFVLVTSASHMTRAMLIFKDKNLNPIAAPTNYNYENDGSWSNILNADELWKTQIAMHEYIGFLWQKLKTIIN